MSREPDNEIWLRMKGEPQRAYSHFSTYRDLGHDRSLKALATKLGKSHSHMRSLSSHWSWTDRAIAFDDFCIEQERKFQVGDRAAMKKRHIQTSLAVQQKLVARLNVMTAAELNKLPFAALVYAMDVAQRLEREARGEASEGAGGHARVEFTVHAPNDQFRLTRTKTTPRITTCRSR